MTEKRCTNCAPGYDCENGHYTKPMTEEELTFWAEQQAHPGQTCEQYEAQRHCEVCEHPQQRHIITSALAAAIPCVDCTECTGYQ